jgi:hypothetical protein
MRRLTRIQKSNKEDLTQSRKAAKKSRKQKENTKSGY